MRLLTLTQIRMVEDRREDLVHIHDQATAMEVAEELCSTLSTTMRTFELLRLRLNSLRNGPPRL